MGSSNGKPSGRSTARLFCVWGSRERGEIFHNGNTVADGEYFEWRHNKFGSVWYQHNVAGLQEHPDREDGSSYLRVCLTGWKTGTGWQYGNNFPQLWLVIDEDFGIQSSTGIKIEKRETVSLIESALGHKKKITLSNNALLMIVSSHESFERFEVTGDEKSAICKVWQKGSDRCITEEVFRADVERKTEIWRKFPEQMLASLTKRRALVRYAKSQGINLEFTLYTDKDAGIESLPQAQGKTKSSFTKESV